MKDADKISASEIINRDPVTQSISSSLTQLKNKMEEQNLRAIPVVEDEELVGVVGYRDLIRFIQFNPESTKIRKVLHQPPEFDESDSLVELCDLRINSGRKMLVSTSGNSLEGVIGDMEFLEAFSQTNQVGDIDTSDIATYELITEYEDSIVDKARHKMLDNNISRLPIIDKSGKLVGVLSSTDLLKTMISREVQSSRGRGRDSSDVKFSGGGGEKHEMSDIDIGEIMDRTPCFSNKHMEGLEAVEKMLEEDAHEIIFTEEGKPSELVTTKDFVRYVKDLKELDTVLVQITGLETPEEKEAVNGKIRRQLQGSLGRKLSRPEELTLRVRKFEKDGRKHRHELNLKLFSEYGIETVKGEGWNLLDVLDDILEKLNRKIRDKKEKRQEKH